jgi:2-methylcitrate dehydratase PrpD
VLPDICLQHLLALMLVDGTVSFRSAHDKERMQDPQILRERDKVRLIPDEELSRRLPRREAIVEVQLADGRSFTEHVEAVRGTAENPMTIDEVSAKARDLVAPVLGKTRSEGLIDRVLHIESLTSIRELRPFLTSSAG